MWKAATVPKGMCKLFPAKDLNPETRCEVTLHHHAALEVITKVCKERERMNMKFKETSTEHALPD